MARSSAVLDGLTPQQAAAATQTGAVLVLAGAAPARPRRSPGRSRTASRCAASWHPGCWRSHRAAVDGMLSEPPRAAVPARRQPSLL